jgi:hypothetical protein
MNPESKKVARPALKVAGVLCTLVGVIWLLMAAAQWWQMDNQACSDLGAMDWFHDFAREELPHYYKEHGSYPTNILDVLLARYGQRADYGDNFRTNMMSRIVYASDGQSFKFTWTTPKGKLVILSGESGQIVTDTWVVTNTLW